MSKQAVESVLFCSEGSYATKGDVPALPVLSKVLQVVQKSKKPAVEARQVEKMNEMDCCPMYFHVKELSIPLTKRILKMNVIAMLIWASVLLIVPNQFKNFVSGPSLFSSSILCNEASAIRGIGFVGTLNLSLLQA